ncbi:MAG: hypothetical protein B6I20_10715 [Bacteroidetes bacterium 4572_117]|nr:MAG: hypothetical protein B6I20_10715 [Bacteroidetes bacterium 4572_117]
MRLAKSIFLLLFILTIHKCKAQYQAQRHYGDTLRYAYIVLFENENQLTSDKKLKIEQRLNQLSYLIKKESQGNLHIQAIPVYIDVHSLNLKSLHYKHHTFFNWIDCLMETGRIKPNIDIISFTPAIKMPS